MRLQGPNPHQISTNERLRVTEVTRESNKIHPYKSGTILRKYWRWSCKTNTSGGQVDQGWTWVRLDDWTGAPDRSQLSSRFRPRSIRYTDIGPFRLTTPPQGPRARRVQ